MFISISIKSDKLQLNLSTKGLTMRLLIFISFILSNILLAGEPIPYTLAQKKDFCGKAKINYYEVNGNGNFNLEEKSIDTLNEYLKSKDIKLINEYVDQNYSNYYNVRDKLLTIRNVYNTMTFSVRGYTIDYTCTDDTLEVIVNTKGGNSSLLTLVLGINHLGNVKNLLSVSSMRVIPKYVKGKKVYVGWDYNGKTRWKDAPKYYHIYCQSHSNKPYYECTKDIDQETLKKLYESNESVNVSKEFNSNDLTLTEEFKKEKDTSKLAKMMAKQFNDELSQFGHKMKVYDGSYLTRAYASDNYVFIYYVYNKQEIIESTMIKGNVSLQNAYSTVNSYEFLNLVRNETLNSWESNLCNGIVGRYIDKGVLVVPTLNWDDGKEIASMLLNKNICKKLKDK